MVMDLIKGELKVDVATKCLNYTGISGDCKRNKLGKEPHELDLTKVAYIAG